MTQDQDWGILTGKRLNRRDFLKVGGAGLAGAAVIASGCAGRQNGGGGKAGKPLTPRQKKQAEKFGLSTDKPYAGTQLNFLICCHTAAQFASLDNLTKEEFTKLTGISVKWGDIPFDSFQSKLTAEASSGAGAYDLAAWIDSWGPSIKGSLVPLSDKIDQAKIDMTDFPKAYREAAKLGSDKGTYYGVPLRGHPLMFFYRKDMYSQMGLKPPKTYSDFIDQGLKIKQNEDINPTAMYYARNAGQNMWLFLSHLWSNGGDVFDKNYRPIFNNKLGVEATQRYVNYLLKYKITPHAAVTWAEAEADQAFYKGQAATFMGWWWMYTNMTGPDATKQVRKNTGFAPMPAWKGKKAVSYAQVWNTGILNSSKNPDASWEYIKWMTNAATEKKVVMRQDPAKFNTIVAVHYSNMRNSQVNAQDNGLQQTGAKILKDARTTPMIPEWPEISDSLSTAVNKAAGGSDVQRTLDDTANEVEGIMKRNGYYD